MSMSSGNIGSGPRTLVTQGLSKKTASGSPALPVVALPVNAGLEAMPPGEKVREDASKHDAQLRAAAGLAMHESRTEAALSSWSGKSEKLVALVGTAKDCSEPLAKLTASFSRYFGAPDGKVPARIQKLSTAVAAYVARPENSQEDKTLVEDALRDAVGGVLVALVGTASKCSDPLAELRASFSQYFDAPDGKVPARIQQLSTAVAAYVARPENIQHKELVEAALRDALGGASVLNKLELEYSSGGVKRPTEAKAFFSRSDVKAATQLRDGQINPYIFGRGDGNMIGVVDRARAVLQGSPDQNRLTWLREEVQFPQFIGKWNPATRAFDPVNQYQRMCGFDKNDLGIEPGDKNAYTHLGLEPGVSNEELAERCDHLHANKYVVPEAVVVLKDYFVRNAVFQLQTPEGRAEYDEYLAAKVDPLKQATLEATVVTEAQALLLGSKPNGMRMNALHDTIIQKLQA